MHLPVRLDLLCFKMDSRRCKKELQRLCVDTSATAKIVALSITCQNKQFALLTFLYFLTLSYLASPSHIHLEHAVTATQSLFLRDLPTRVCVGPMQPGALLATDLPLKDLDRLSPSIKHFVDIILDIPKSSIDMGNLKAIFRDQAWDELPEVMKLKDRPNFETIIQYVFLPQSDDQLCLLKHVYVAADKVPSGYDQSLLRGNGKEIKWGHQNKKLLRKAFQWMLGQLGGCNSESILLLQKSESLHQVLPHLRMTGGSSSKSMVKWTRVIWSSSKGSITISTWKVVPSMVGRNAWRRKLWSPWPTTQTAKLCQRYDLTIVDFEPEIRDIMEKIVPSLQHHALWLLGEAGKGKTPLGPVIAMMLSRYHGGQGTYRTTSDLDFFKGIPFTKKFPALDDGNISGEEVTKIKAFTDVRDDAPMKRARWTSAKYVRHQLRVVPDNAYNPDAEPEDNDKSDSDLVVSHEDFFLMIRPVLGSMLRNDAMAILKRSAIIIFGKTHITYRFPSDHETET